jgi:hypothetical protein
MLKEEFGSISVTDWIKGLKGRSILLWLFLILPFLSITDV